MGIIGFLFCSTVTAVNRVCTPKKKYTSLDEIRAQMGLPDRNYSGKKNSIKRK